MDNLEKQRWMRAFSNAEQARKVAIPSTSGTIYGDGTTYSESSGGPGFRSMINRNVINEYKTPEAYQDEFLQRLKEDYVRKEAQKQLMQEGFNPFGGEV